MKTKLSFIVLAVVVVAVAVWAFQRSHADSQKTTEIAALQKKVTTLTHEVTAAKNQGARIVEVINTTPVGNNSNPASKPNPGSTAQAMASPEIIASLKNDVADAIALPPGAERDNALMKTLAAYAAVDGPTALAESVELTGGNRGRARIQIFDAWSAAQPADAAAALINNAGLFSSATTFNTITADVAKNWLNQDPAAAVKWIDALPKGGQRDNAVAQIVSVYAQSDPATALTWADTITGPAIRNQQTVQLVGQWAAQDPAAAAAAARSALNNLTGMTDAQVLQLRGIATGTAGR